MLAALLTTCFFACSVSLARSSVACLGPQRANLSRQVFGLMMLALWACTAGQGWGGPARGSLFLSGVIGFGVGDWAIYEALPRIGPALTLLLCQCLAAPLAALIEWAWLGTSLTGRQLCGAVLILGGVALALIPPRSVASGAKVDGWGIALGILAAGGQAGGAVLSRQAFLQSAALHFHLDAWTAAYQRLWGGLAFGILLQLARRCWPRRPAGGEEPPTVDWRRGLRWAAANALAGAVLGVGCYQWALQSTPSAVVLPIVALAPLVVILIGMILHREWPRPLVVAGSVLAVAGVGILVK